MTPTTPTFTLAPIQIRAARPDDAITLRDLAELDSAAVLHGDVLVAVVDVEIRAALSLSDGRAIADPFRRTADLVELLRTRAHLMGLRDGSRRRRFTLRRPAAATPVALAR
jgi:hypothetical protein